MANTKDLFKTASANKGDNEGESSPPVPKKPSLDVSEFYQLIRKEYHKHGIPVDKRGNAYISGRGGYYKINEIRVAHFNEYDLIIALLLKLQK